MTPKIDKSNWPAGPWQDEPDRVEWLHAGLPCLANRGPHHGAWCGYVAVPPGHSWHGLDCDDVRDRCPELDVHGGLTFAAAAARGTPWWWVPDPGTDPTARALARTAADDDTARLVYADWLEENGRESDGRLLRLVPQFWYVGFACANTWDVCPGREAREAALPEHLRYSPPRWAAGGGMEMESTYCDLVYVTAEVDRLAETAARAELDPSPDAAR